MGNNNLCKVENTLRSIAKRYKSVKYSLGLVILFLMMGVSAFSEEIVAQEAATKQEVMSNEQIATSKDNLKGSIGNLHSKIETARAENAKSLEGLKLELIQLMEQGDQVVKSPWASWQFGLGYTYDSWQSSYKGHGDKKTKEVLKRDTSGNPMGRFIEGTSSASYGTTDLDLVSEPVAEIEVSARIRPKSINKQAPNLQLPTVAAPASPQLNIAISSPAPIVTPNIVIQNINPTIVEPSANPFSDFSWNWLGTTAVANPNASSAASYSMGDNIDISGGTFWSGVKTDGTLFEGAGYSGATQDTTTWNAAGFPASMTYDRRHQSIINSYNGRWTGQPGNKITGGTFYVAGGTGTPGATATGTEAFHLVADVHLENVTANLYGRAAFINAEAFRGGQTTMDKVTVNVMKDNNTVFNIQGAGPAQDAAGFGGGQFSTRFGGNANITVNTKSNTVYAVKNFAGGLRLDNTGEIIFNGASNIGVSFLTWVPDKSKYIASQFPNYANGGNQGEGTLDKYIPYVKLSPAKPMKLYGDENVGIFFNTKLAGRADNVGIHQGKFELYFDIGGKLNSSGTATQTASGQLAKTGYTDKTVDGSVGIYAISGQRPGVSHTNLAGGPFFAADPIHNLEMDTFKITFGKYAKNGFMFLAKNGTVIEIKQGNQAEFSDGISGVTTKEDATGLGTIIAYAEGKWTAAGTKLAPLTGHTLENLSTEVIVDKKLNMMSRKGMAFFAKNNGKITVKKDAKAYGYNSIVAYADTKGIIEIGTTATPANITAKDEGVDTTKATSKLEKYKNIGAYAKAGAGASLTDITKITVNGNVDINGLGAIADGKGASVHLKGTGNKIATGTDGALFAKNYGKVEFGGGTIVNKDNGVEKGMKDKSGKAINDHLSVTPFYATANGKIEFTGNTTINMYDGVLVFGEASDYNATINPSSTAKYQGTNKITVNLMKNGVNLGVFKKLKGATNVVWNGNAGVNTYVNTLKAIPKFHAINTNNKSFKSTLTEGTLTINSNVNLSDNNDRYNDIIMEREVVTVAVGKTVTGTRKGLSMGSNSGAASNAESGYVNKGNVVISGGTTSKGVAGINVSYGRILNDASGIVKIDNGAGLYATNDSRIENKGAINLTGSGTGIAARGISETKGAPTFTYGNTGKIEIVNSGKINIVGKNSIGIYAENNKGIASSNVTVNNSGKITITSENAVGIALKGKNNNGGAITLSGTGNSDIKLGKKGIGVYAENSSINVNSNYGIETGDNGVGIYTNRNLTSNKIFDFKYSGSTTGTGIAILFAGQNPTNNLKINLNNSTNTTKGMVGIFANGSGTLTNTGNIVGTSKEAEFGIVANNTNVVNSGNISLGNANTLSKANVGIYEKTVGKTITNSGDIKSGNNTIGLYGYGITNTGKITVGDGSIGVYSQGGNITINNLLEVGRKEAVGVFTVGANQNITSTGTLKIGDTSYGFVLKGTNTNLTANNGTVTLGNDSVFAYADSTGVMTNNTKLVATGSNNYGLYSGGTVRNLADINFTSGIGNVGIYSIKGGTAINGNSSLPIASNPTITVSGTDRTSKVYGIGMAAGYVDENTGVLKSTGNIENYGTINVLKSGSIGMYAVGRGSTAKNYGTINLSGKSTVGMYLDQGAVGENHGTIKTVPNATNDGIIGVVALNGAVFKNYGNITINAPNGVGFYGADNQSYEDKGGSINVSGAGSQPKKFGVQNDTGKGVKGVKIVVPPSGTGVTVERDGRTITPTPVDTTIASPNATHVTVGGTTLNLSSINIPKNMGSASEMGMYVDTSGVKYTNPIKGLQHLTNLRKVNLVFGSEASLYSNLKDIQIGANILKPYNKAIEDVSSSSGSLKWAVSSASLTWIATVTQNSDFTISKLYMSKIPYTSFAKDSDTFNFMQGLESRYGASGIGTREKALYDKLNGIGKGEPALFAQAVDQMKGHQYANVEQRVEATGNIL
ncbi:autotransporter-associated N-terminal domain-containing protein, partial [Fusobacterium hwasookii]